MNERTNNVIYSLLSYFLSRFSFHLEYPKGYFLFVVTCARKWIDIDLLLLWIFFIVDKSSSKHKLDRFDEENQRRIVNFWQRSMRKRKRFSSLSLSLSLSFVSIGSGQMRHDFQSMHFHFSYFLSTATAPVVDSRQQEKHKTQTDRRTNKHHRWSNDTIRSIVLLLVQLRYRIDRSEEKEQHVEQETSVLCPSDDIESLKTKINEKNSVDFEHFLVSHLIRKNFSLENQFKQATGVEHWVKHGRDPSTNLLVVFLFVMYSKKFPQRKDKDFLLQYRHYSFFFSSSLDKRYLNHHGCL